MTRHRPRRSYGHEWRRIAPDTYAITWAWDRYYPRSRLRYPQVRHAITDRAGAERFAKRWGIDGPDEREGGERRAVVLPCSEGGADGTTERQ